MNTFTKTLGTILAASTIAIAGCGTDVTVKNNIAEKDPAIEAKDTEGYIVLEGYPSGIESSYKSEGGLNRLSLFVRDKSGIYPCYVEGNQFDSDEVTSRYLKAVSSLKTLGEVNSTLRVRGKFKSGTLEIKTLSMKLGQNQFEYTFK